MGYRSEVAIKCQKGAYDYINSIDGAYGWDRTLTDGTDFILEWEWIKWYEEYEGIKAIVDALNALDEIEDPYDTSMGYKMIRLGEDDGDVEERSNTDMIEFYYTRRFDTAGFERSDE